MKKKLLIVFGIIILLGLGICLLDDEEVEETPQTTNVQEEQSTGYIKKRKYYTQLAGDGQDTVTIMIYMIGSDLESDQSGCATNDLEEIKNAVADRKVNIVLQTGGTTDWVDPDISGGTTQRFTIEDGQLILQQDLGQLCMTSPKTLSNYISWASKNYKADRNILIFWDHGGGTAMGFGSDQYYEDDNMELSEISQALKSANVKFDFIGFDACLMGTIETAYALEPYADYLLASEELEPGTGWYYTDWLSALSENTSMDTKELGKKIIDDFVKSNDGFLFSEECTLALIDLSGIKSVYQSVCEYMDASIIALEDHQFKNLSKARANTRSYGEGGFEQIDIIDYIERAGLEEGDDLKKALQEVIAYNGTNIEGANGLAMYYPYDCPEYYSDILAQLKAIHYGDSCTAYFNRFISILTGVQSSKTKSMSPIEKKIGYTDETSPEDYSNCDWYDDTNVEQYSNQNDYYDFNEREIIDKGDYYALSLSEKEWEDISYIDMQVFLDDGEGYIDLGNDNVYEFDDEGDLIVDFDYTWVALNGQIVPYYAEKEYEEGEEWYTYGYVPAVLNRNGKEQDIEIMVYWGNDCENGTVMGYREAAEGMSTAGKGYRPFQADDVIWAVCDYYTYEGDYQDCYNFGEKMKVGKGLKVSYEEIDSESYGAWAWCMLRDIYNNEFYTEGVVYE